MQYHNSRQVSNLRSRFLAVDLFALNFSPLAKQRLVIKLCRLVIQLQRIGAIDWRFESTAKYVKLVSDLNVLKCIIFQCYRFGNQGSSRTQCFLSYLNLYSYFWINFFIFVLGVNLVNLITTCLQFLCEKFVLATIVMIILMAVSTAIL